jgi:iron complex outermembrane receptor protein
MNARLAMPGVLLLAAAGMFAQTPAPSPTVVITPINDTVIVTGIAEPLPLKEVDREVYVLPVATRAILTPSLNEALREDSSIDIRQRGAGGAQADLSIRGATFAQSLVLLNGLRMNDAQAAHNNLDLPVPLTAVDRVEVLHGSSSTFYGADAIGGVADVLTLVPRASELRVAAGGGNYGSDEERIRAGLLRGRFSELIAGERSHSAGFLPDRDYRNEAASADTRLHTTLGESDLFLGASDRAFGADQFYGSYPSWERLKGWFAALSQQFGKNTDAAFAYRRHTDNFILFRDRPAIYANNHATESWQAIARRVDSVHSNTLAYGAETDRDHIGSNNLGDHNRTRGAVYADFNLRAFSRVTASIGLREEIIEGSHAVFSPNASAAWWIKPSLRVRGGATRAYRLPTYTDLYYHDPANFGNAHLRPESAWNFEAGPEWTPTPTLLLSSTVFYRRVSDGIDYVRVTVGQPYYATNLTQISFVGVESAMQYIPTTRQRFTLGWTALQGDQGSLTGATSKYVFSHPSQNAIATWTGSLGTQMLLNSGVRVVQRYGADPYAVVDLGGTRSTGRVRPYIRFANIANTGYQEIYGVRMPGRSVVAGIELMLAAR